MIVVQQDVVMAKIAALMLISVRLAALVLAAPVFSASAVALPVRIALTFSLAVALARVVTPPAVDLVSPEGAAMLAREALIGLAIGFLFQLAFAAVATAGEQMAAAMGLGFASMMDPQTGSQSPVVTQFLTILFTLVFLVLEGHHLVLRQIAASYEVLPIGGGLDFGLFRAMAQAAALIFSGALLVAAPVVVMLFLVNLLIGFMTRVAPQMNIFSVGFPITILAGFAVLLLSLPAVAQVMSGLLQTVAALARDMVIAAGGRA